MSGIPPYDVCVVGHVTQDLIRDERGDVRVQPGGGAYYGAAACARLGLRTGLITRLAPGDDDLLADLHSLGIDIRRKPSAATTVFEAMETGRAGHRVYRPVSIADAFEPGDFEGIAARAVLMDPLTRHDDFAAVLAAAAETAPLVALDAQGFVRKFIESPATHSAAETALAGFAHVTVLKADAAEAEVITGRRDPEAAARALAVLGVAEAIVTFGPEGSVICAGNMTAHVPAFPVAVVVDPTGAGDTYLAAYLAARLEGREPVAAAHFGAAAASLKLSRHGAFMGTRDEVEHVRAAHAE